MTQFQFANSDDPVPGNGNPPAEFTIKAKPGRDLCAPILYKPVALSAFKRARVAFNAQWTHRYDQGGLLFVLNYRDGSRKWLKAGIELTHGKPHLSAVTKDRYADWSLLPVPSGGNAATLEMVREADNSLWVYLVEGVSKSPIREVTWVFEEKEVTECWVGVFAARPGNEGGELEVNFGHLIVE
ncbi:hypothetical protein N7532_003268 [Penicillium argentinense]|uniref:Uncharacterized protein n=1 Tax=Penicillium argentinense TaxID=1131581 RepID=A0A9W9FM70_9EURO|nr:uncharacterized protein N7532_003268 [Penicillium argentinense]KAJ5102739.1 hypothetical protein N7532_003268 [Penicillium argentinense]